MSAALIVTIVIAVFGAIGGVFGTVLGIAIRATLRNIELQLAHVNDKLVAQASSAGRDDSRMEKAIGELRTAIDESQEEGRAADTYLGTIQASLAEQVAVLRTILEERFGRSTSSARFPKVKQPSEPPAFLPPEARVVVRQTPTGTGVESSGRYAAYVPPIPKGPKR